MNASITIFFYLFPCNFELCCGIFLLNSPTTKFIFFHYYFIIFLWYLSGFFSKFFIYYRSCGFIFVRSSQFDDLGFFLVFGFLLLYADDYSSLSFSFFPTCLKSNQIYCPFFKHIKFIIIIINVKFLTGRQFIFRNYVIMMINIVLKIIYLVFLSKKKSGFPSTICVLLICR